MGDNKKFRGPLGQRIFIIFLSLIFGVLFFWLLRFITKDIGGLKGPDRNAISFEYVGRELTLERSRLDGELKRIKSNIANLTEQEKILSESTASLQTTITQLLAIQKQSLDDKVDFPEESRVMLAESQKSFLENQKEFQAISKSKADLTLQKQQTEEELAGVNEQIRIKTRDADEEYSTLKKKHDLKIAGMKLAVLIPIFVVSAWLFVKKRSGTYGPIMWATFAAAFIQISLVVHAYFPKEYFKYIALLVIIGIVIRILVYLMKGIVSPKKEFLLKQYQQSYDKNICPVCGKPIRIGPNRYYIPTKRKGIILTEQAGNGGEQQAYNCPSCGTSLFGKCGNCGKIRHKLLPYCEHCGDESGEWA